MDKLAKRAAVAVVVSAAVAGSALSYGLYRTAQSFETRVRMGKSVPAFEATIQLPDASLMAPLAAPEPAEPSPESPVAKPDLASAFGSALGIDPAKVAARSAPPEAQPNAPQSAGLQLGFTTPARETKLGERDAKSLEIRQTGGSDRQRKVEKTEGERISFEMDLAQP